MIRVCHLVRQFDPGIGGLEAFVASLATHLREFECESTVVTLDRVFTAPKISLAANALVGAVPVQRVPMLGHRRAFLPFIPSSALEAYDILHVHGIDGMFERVAREPRRAHQGRIATSHGGFFHTPWMATLKRAYFASITTLAARSYDHLIANSEADRRMLSALGPETLVIANGVEPLSASLAAGRDLLYLGRLASHKHVDRLIALLAEPSLSTTRLHIVGPAWDVSMNTLMTHARSLGVSERVQVYGHLPSEALQTVVNACGVFVSASSYEGFGMSLIEAMSAGLIPVVEPNASFVDLVSGSPVGRVAPFDDPSVAAAIIREELDRLTLARRQKAQRYAQHYGWPAHAEQTASLYRNVLSRAQ
ncbi:MAG: glycosyltransferase family 4 protein [Hyphomonadaceae bacterium]|nr:glycosyltransferase family 4 protein [Hyphomonadaceae bacterium]